MSRRSVIIIGDLQPAGSARSLNIMSPIRFQKGRAVACGIMALATFLGVAACFYPSGPRSVIANADHPAVDDSPRSFPPWVEVPHLADPRRNSPGGDAVGSRSFLHSQFTEAVDPALTLPPRVNPRLPLVGLAPLDAEQWSTERTASWNEGNDQSVPMQTVSIYRDAAVSDAIATRGPSETQPIHGFGEVPAAPVSGRAGARVGHPEAIQAQIAERTVPIVESQPPSKPIIELAISVEKAIPDLGSLAAGALESVWHHIDI